MRTPGILLVALLVGLSSVSSPGAAPRRGRAAKQKADAGYRLTPTKSAASKTGVYIPGDLNDALAELRKMLPPRLLREMRAQSGGERDRMAARYHMSLGLWLRNNWGLWAGSRLAKWFNGVGIFHPDDMSGILLTSFGRHLRGQSVDLKGQLAYYQDYWKRAREEEKREAARVERAKAVIAKMMLGLRRVGAPQAVLTLPQRTCDGLRVRYAAPFAGGVLLTAKETTGRGDNDFVTPCHFVDRTRRTVHPVRIPEMRRVENGVVTGDGAAIFHGTAANARNVLVRVDATRRHRSRIPAPPGSGSLRLGLDERGAVLAVRPRAVYRWNGAAWETLVDASSGALVLPRSGVPPRILNGRLYLRDEGRSEDDKRLSWLDLSRPKAAVTYFDEDVGVVGPNGPRWENVWSYAQTPGGVLWLAAGDEGNQTLLTWRPGAGYRIALVHGRTTFDFDGDILGGAAASPADTRSGSMPISGVEAAADGDDGVWAVGPTGLFRIRGNEIRPLVAFKNTTQEVPINGASRGSVLHWDWTPTHLVALERDTFLLAGHWGGVYLLQRVAAPTGKFRLVSLDEKVGKPVTF